MTEAIRKYKILIIFKENTNTHVIVYIFYEDVKTYIKKKGKIYFFYLFIFFFSLKLYITIFSSKMNEI